MSHSAEIIAVGTELLLGNITNTNARDISRALSAVGVNVFWHTVVGDNPERLRAALDIARNRADIIITTGLRRLRQAAGAAGGCAGGHPGVFCPERAPDHAGEQPPAGGIPGGLRHF